WAASSQGHRKSRQTHCEAHPPILQQNAALPAQHPSPPPPQSPALRESPSREWPSLLPGSRCRCKKFLPPVAAADPASPRRAPSIRSVGLRTFSYASRNEVETPLFILMGGAGRTRIHQFGGICVKP